MTNLMENIINEYVDNIIAEYGLSKAEAIELLEDTLQDYDVEQAILERVATINQGVIKNGKQN